MSPLILVIIIGLLGGMSVGMQSPLASIVNQHLGTLESVFIVHIGGAIVAALFLLPGKGGQLPQWRGVPWYALLAGVFGLGVISAVGYTIPRIGVSATVTLIVAGQLLVSVIIDHFGLLGNEVRALDVPRIVEIGVLFLGVWLIVR